MKHITTCIILLSTLYTSAYAEVFKHVDENGRVSFADIPQDKTDEKIKVTPTNNIKIEQSNPQGKDFKLTPKHSKAYRISITSPSEGKTFKAPLEPILIKAVVTPSIPNTFKVVIRHNGAAMETSGLTAILTNPSRGRHNFIAVLIDKNGETLAQSEPSFINIQIPFVRPSSS